MTAKVGISQSSGTHTKHFGTMYTPNVTLNVELHSSNFQQGLFTSKETCDVQVRMKLASNDAFTGPCAALCTGQHTECNSYSPPTTNLP